MIKFILISLAFYLSSAKFGLNIGSFYISRDTATCIAQQNISRAAIGFLDYSGNINTQFLDYWLQLQDAGIETVDAIVGVNDGWDPVKICNNITNYLPGSFDGIVWFEVDSNSGSWKLEVGKRVAFLENLAIECKSHGFDVGIFSKLTSWTLIMGTPTAGSDKLRALPVWYINENGAENFNDFKYANFGRWPNATMKEYKSSPYMCNSYWNGLDYYEN